MPMTFFAEKKHIFQLDPPETLTPKSKSGLVVKPFGACHPKKKTGSKQEAASSSFGAHARSDAAGVRIAALVPDTLRAQHNLCSETPPARPGERMYSFFLIKLLS